MVICGYMHTKYLDHASQSHREHSKTRQSKTVRCWHIAPHPSQRTMEKMRRKTKTKKTMSEHMLLPRRSQRTRESQGGQQRNTQVLRRVAGSLSSLIFFQPMREQLGRVTHHVSLQSCWVFLSSLISRHSSRHGDYLLPCDNEMLFRPVLSEVQSHSPEVV